MRKREQLAAFDATLGNWLGSIHNRQTGKILRRKLIDRLWVTVKPDAGQVRWDLFYEIELYLS